MNAYQAIQHMREQLAESTAKHWSDQLLLDSLNKAKSRLYMKLSMTTGDWFMKSKAVTFTNSVAALPTDCAKPSFLLHATEGYKIPFTLNARRQDGNVFPSYESLDFGDKKAFVYGKNIKLSYTYSGNLDLWYDQKDIALHQGTAGDVSGFYLLDDDDLPATFEYGFQLDSSFRRSYEQDYYNGLYVNYVGSSGNARRAEIVAYSGISGIVQLDTAYSLEANATYGFESNLPQEAWDATLARALYIAAMKPAGLINSDILSRLRDDVQMAEDVLFDWVSTRIKDTNYML